MTFTAGTTAIQAGLILYQFFKTEFAVAGEVKITQFQIHFKDYYMFHVLY